MVLLAGGGNSAAIAQDPRSPVYTIVPSPGFEAQVRPRSGLALRHGITVLNSPGTIDSDYRGEVQVLLANLGIEPFVILRGERIAQLVVARVERAHLVETARLAPTARGSGGFGSTGTRAPKGNADRRPPRGRKG